MPKALRHIKVDPVLKIDETVYKHTESMCSLSLYINIYLYKNVEYSASESGNTVFVRECLVAVNTVEMSCKEEDQNGEVNNFLIFVKLFYKVFSFGPLCSKLVIRPKIRKSIASYPISACW